MSAQQKKHPFDFKTQYGLGFNPQDDEIVVGFFCGGIRTRETIVSDTNRRYVTNNVPSQEKPDAQGAERQLSRARRKRSNPRW